MTQLAANLSSFLATRQVQLYGIADVARCRERFPEIPWQVPDYLPCAVVIAYPLLAGALETVIDQPTHIYFHHYRQVNLFLDRAALEAAGFLEANGFRGLPVAASQTLDAEDLTAHLSHRHLGFMAGLGWRGRNNLLVNEQYGSRFRLAAVLTDAPLPVGSPREDELCGNCNLCARACPAGAIGSTAEAFQLEKCHALLSEFRKIQRLGQRVCGVCQRACIRFRRKGGAGRRERGNRNNLLDR